MVVVVVVGDVDLGLLLMGGCHLSAMQRAGALARWQLVTTAGLVSGGAGGGAECLSVGVGAGAGGADAGAGVGVCWRCSPPDTGGL